MSSAYISYVMEGSPVDCEFGEVDLLEPVHLHEVIESSMSGQQYTSIKNDLKSSPTNELCLVYIPSRMILTGILQFFTANLDLISNIRILRHATATSSFFAVLTMKDEQAYQTIYKEYNSRTMSSSDSSCCIFLPMKSSTSGAVPNDTFVTKVSHAEGEVNDEQARCPVCLDVFAASHSMCFTTCCSHSFHMHCMLRLQGDQCPVCRFRPDADDEFDSYHECFECGWQGKALEGIVPQSISESRLSTDMRASTAADLWVCLICGFTGCGASHGRHIQQHYEETLHTYAQNCDTRQVWDFAGDGYVHALILKDNSMLQLDNTQGSSDLFTPHFSYQQALWEERTPLNGEQETSLVSAKLEAAARHYNQLLAWQLEQNRLLYETRLQRIRDSIPATASAASGNNIVGSSNAFPSSSSGSASNRSRLTSQQAAGRGAGRGPRASSWRENMLLSLRSERAKVLKQLEGAHTRLVRAETEFAVLKELEDAYARNGETLQGRVDAAANALQEQKNTNRLEIHNLEERVGSLMTELDLISKTETGSKHFPSVDTATCSAIDEEDEYR